jgi:hypothetical protein
MTKVGETKLMRTLMTRTTKKMRKMKMKTRTRMRMS